MFRAGLSVCRAGSRACRVVAVAMLAVLALGLPETVAVDDLSKQVKLADSDIKGFISIQDDIRKVAGKIEASGDVLTPELREELDGIAKRHGFSDFARLQLVAANIAAILSGFDPDSGEYQDPREDLRQDILEIQSDDKLDASEKERVVKELESELKETPEIEFKENIELIKKNREEIEKALE